MRWTLFPALVLLVGPVPGFPAAGPAAASLPPDSRVYSSRVRPLLQTYCFKCHNADEHKGGVNFASLKDGEALGKRGLWRRGARRLAVDEMPPEGAKQPTAAEKQELIRWMKFAAEYVDCDPNRIDPGPSLLRRLTRTEYDNTIRDLLGIRFSAALAVGMPTASGEGHFDNLAANLSLSPALMEKYFAAADKVIEKLFASDRPAEQARKKLFSVLPGPKVPEREAGRRVVTRLVARAYRRPPREEDVRRLMGFYDRARDRGESFEGAIRAVLKPVLVSPQFLFRIEENHPAQRTRPGAAVSDHELVVRLSYFLWATMPDEELFRLADEKKLSEPEELEQQVRRMLADRKARALTDVFAVQWLQLGKLASARPSTEFFPTFRGPLKQAMYDEVTSFFDNLRLEDRSVLDLLDADYTFANSVLGRHYGLAGVTGKQMQKVSLKPDQHRGGLLGMAAVLSLTSHTFRTSPTQRGKYVLEVILGTPPPPPPPNVGMIRGDRPGKKKQPLTFREQLALHATQSSCAGCHRKIDPLGFALDNYDPIGAWRESTPDRPLDVSGVLPTGEKVNGASDLKKVLLSRKDDFARNLVERMLVYSLGRELESGDECAIRESLADLKKNDYRFAVLIRGVIHSVPFRERRVKN
jgi:Protein of unknown function (DUF1592)/Protein of unknown function (DUF1588)/Protein of unknown function (DUF1585)/Protein of unknown function (DUF1595)/Protein of unknown function (DUF1587)